MKNYYQHIDNWQRDYFVKDFQHWCEVYNEVKKSNNNKLIGKSKVRFLMYIYRHNLKEDHDILFNKYGVAVDYPWGKKATKYDENGQGYLF